MEKSNDSDGEIDPAELSLIRGDAIGETAYSEKFVLQTLLQLTKELDENSSDYVGNQITDLKDDVEADLCVLWDMSTEKDVAEYLFEHEFLSLALAVFTKSQQPRLTEIIMGILSNMSCHDSLRSKLIASEPLVEAAVSLLACSDIPTLKEDIRFFRTCLWNFAVQSEDRPRSPEEFCIKIKTSEEMWRNLTFILANSLNIDLLKSTAELIELLLMQLDFDKPDWSETVGLRELAHALLESLVQLKQGRTEEMTNEEERSVAELRSIGCCFSCLYRLCWLEEGRSSLSDKADSAAEQITWYLGLLLNMDHDSEGADDSQLEWLGFMYEAVNLLEVIVLSHASYEALKLCCQMLLRRDKHEGLEDFKNLQEAVLDLWEKVAHTSQADLLVKSLETCSSPDLSKLQGILQNFRPSLMEKLLSLDIDNRIRDMWEPGPSTS